MTSFYLAPAINFPTRVTPDTATLIDNFFSNFSQDIVDPTIIVNDLSDHFPILLWFGNGAHTLKSKPNGSFRTVNDVLIEPV